MLRKLLLLIALLGTFYSKAQTYYWVGGSGYWNDVTHWSHFSGGSPVTIIPSANSEIIFDDQSASSSFTIHALHSFGFKSIITQNTHFDATIIGSPNVDLTINGNVELNDHFFFKLNGKINLVPQMAAKYQFSHNKLSNDVFINANADVELGMFTTTKSLSLTGNFSLKNSILFSDIINFSNNNLHLNNVSIQSRIINRNINSSITSESNIPSKIITNQNNITASDLNYFNNINGLALKPLAACFPPLVDILPKCSGACDGQIVIDFSGCGNPPFDIFIPSNCATPNISITGIDPLVTGNSYTVTGICGCANAYAVSINNNLGENGGALVAVGNPPASNISFTNTPPSCFGACDGKLILRPQFPTATPITAVWSNGVTHVGIVGPDTLKNLCAGLYTVTTTNLNGCVETFTANLGQPQVLLANGSSSSVTCNGSCNGSATVAPTGGTIPYTYSWLSASSTPSTSTTTTIGNLCPGVITMTVTDSKSCTANYSATIIQPPAVTLTVTKTDLICGSLCDGTASVTATGGIGPFSYTWAPSGGNASQATALCAGIYTCTVTNNGNCIRTITVNISSPPTLTATPTQTDVLCNNVCSGAINLNPSGGTGAYSYAWSPNISNTVTAINVCDGVYSYTLTDAALCTYTNTVTITEPLATTLTIASTSISCNGACDGTATATMLGGVGPYTFTWSPGNPTGQGTNAISGLCPGTYTLNSRDFNLCLKTQTVLISHPAPILPVVTSTSLTCNAVCNGVINSVPTGGTAPYTFTLQSSGAPITTNPPYTNLCAGLYTVVVRDASGCIATRTVNLLQPNPITLSLTTTTINCFNTCNATISTIVNGGSPSYTYSWSTGATGSSLINQCAGAYSSTVTDVNGCRANANVTVTSIPDLTVSIVPTNPNCNGQCTGIATTNVSGGTPNYTINLNNGSSGNIIPNLCQGTYTATVTDFNGCVKTQTVAIVTPPAITLTTTNGTVSCAGSCDGTVSVTASGGTAGYFYNWNSTPSQTTTIASGLCVGNYVASVTDALGCIASAAASVAQPTVLTASIGNIIPSCNICIGGATAAGIGGTGPYTYSWSPGGQTIANPSNLCIGIQTVVVTDSKGCTTTQTVLINQTVITVITTSGNTLTCNGVCNGVATANPAGGLLPYTYTWTPAPVAPIQNTQTANGLCAGTHTVIVSDANGCSSTNTVSFVNPPAITLTVTHTDVSCNGLCDGTASAVATGGSGAFSYLWQPGNLSTANISGLCAADYTLVATDNNSCSQTQVVSVIQTNSLSAAFTFTNPSTCTSSDGSVSFVPSGGTAPYTFTWTPGGSSNPLTNLAAGNYTLTVNDFAGCTQTIVATLNNPTGPTVTVTSNSIACFGACTGTATLSIVGSGPFTVNGLAIPSNTTILSGLCAGINIPVIEDINSCVTNQTVNISQPTQLTASGLVTDDACNSACTGSINLTPLGGTLPYTYSWSPAGGSVQDPTALCANNYSVDITDGNNCLITNTFVVIQPTALTLSFNKQDVLCNGICDGGVKAIVSGGTAPYSYTWTAAAPFVTANIDTLANICSGTYSVSVTDFNGCIISGTISIGQPALLTSTITTKNVKCNGQCNGSATITASGGTGPYSFSYNTTPVTPTFTISGLCIGTYTGIATDANGCSISTNFIISEPLPIVVTTTVSQPLCNAVCNGSVATTVTGGNPNYSYNWIASGGPVPNPTGLCAGNYTVVVTDDSLCTGQALVVLTDPASLIANITFTNPTCNLGCNGIVSANPIGGTGPFSYSWATPAINTNTTVSNLCAGNYTLTLTDNNSCQDVQIVTLVDPIAISVIPVASPATCGVSNGSIDALPGNGNQPFTYSWLPPIPAGQATNTLVTGIPAGTYTVVVTDATACTTTISIPLSNSNGPSGATIASTMVTCNGQLNGAADISNPVGGTPGYTLSWINPVSATTLVTGLGAGTYTAQIIDANNCLFFQSIVITEPQPIDDNEIITSAACLGNCNGVIALNPTGGNAGAYTYSWSPSAATGTISNICPGVYTATITDVLGCTLVANYNLPSITTITSSTFANNNSCFGNCNGSILATNVAGGLPPYSFVWNDGQSTSVASSLCNGNYSVTITDANGCFNTLPAIVTSPSQVTFTPTITQPNCGLCDGVAIVNPVGGIPGYTYVWSNGQAINTASNLCAGVYNVQITDANGCASTSNVVINNSSTFTGETITQQNVSCSGVCDGTVTVTAIGGTGLITYNWIHNGSASQTLNGLCAGTYFCNMTDANGCTRTASVVIGATTNFTMTPQITQSACSANTGSINVNVVGGTGIYNYVWIPAAANTPSLTNLAPGNYTLTVSDANCSQTQVFAINSVNGPIVTSTQSNISCSGFCDGSISLVVNGGTPAYTTLWSNGSSSLINNGLCSGAYSYTITDAAGCKAVQSFSLITASPIVFSVPDIDNPLCNNNCNGVVTSIPSGGVLPYTFNWIVSTSTTSVANNLCSGNYSVVVSDANGCSAQETYTLTGPTTISITAVVTDANCNGSADGAIDITVTGGTPGTPAYTFTWTPTGAIFTEDLINVTANTYSLQLTDGNGCIVDSSFVVAEPTIVVDNFSISPSACFGNCNGSITLAPTGGTGAYTYSWSPSASNTLTATNLCPGPQTATITDAQGCPFVFNYNVPSLTTITASTLAVNNLCFNDCNGVLTATNIAGGVSPYTIQWNDPLGQPGNTAIGLCTGSYTATITDANGCFNPIPADVSSTSQVTFTPTITEPSCNLCNGSAIVNPIGGTAPYTYLWSNNQIVNTATNLCSGVYAVQITDGNGCVNTTNLVINSSSGITGETIITTSVTCAGSCDGTANVTAVGGTAPISYNWTHNNSTNQTVNGLCAGTYFCNMIDATGCSRTASVVIGAATTLTISSQITQSSCSANTGSITVSASGGTGIYTYNWLPAGNTPTITNLAPGNYTLTVSDGSCSKTQIFSIVSFSAPVINSITKDISCSGLCDGNIAITISAGTPTYSTVWSNGATTNSISALCAGSYSVLVTDAAGCIAVKNYSLSNVTPITFSSPDLNNPQCHDDCNGSLTVIPFGGTMPYTFTWTPGNVNTATTNSLCTGIYSITVADANGCPVANTYSLINPPTLTLTAVITDASCNTALDGAIDITVLGGSPPNSYSWSPTGFLTEDIVNVLSGPNTVTVTDNFGCIIDSTFQINSTITVNAIAGNDTLFCQNGTLLLNGSNSNGGVTYDWFLAPSATSISSSLITSVTPAVGTSSYVLVATNGVCIDRDTIVVNSNALPIVDAGPMVSISLYATAAIGGSPTGPAGSSFNWSPVSTLDNPVSSNPVSGTTITTIYTVTVVDANGCTNSDTVTVFVYPEIIIPNGFSPNGDGKNDTWIIDLLYQFPNVEVEVYNRWGEQLFYSKGYSVPFNGKYKGKDLPVGTYYYVINLNTELYPKPYTGPLTIFR